MVNENNDSGKTFNFYIDESYCASPSAGGYMRCYDGLLCVDISGAGESIKKIGIKLYGGEPSSKGGYDAFFSAEKIRKYILKSDAVKDLIDSIKEAKLGYSPTSDAVSYNYDCVKHEERGRSYFDCGYYSCSQQHSASPLSNLIETEMKRLIPKNKLTGLDYQI
jgi:hypothetical protein